ncbi:MAG: hypothetical protein AVDCRST_MAG77-2616 [uncultured Chloroflexi bacterium]|uniref:Uncharacterized protein n=1 Tax=uncultured Chloroflexota bacterium TaxID=166587 RepID=A0A6J4IY86_9CHLR|nr:MAG: hypothetical protein AVDCRST_MAG77-2616 [uncultured Chloroflexota bacterium]
MTQQGQPGRVVFERQYRTATSEGYHILAGEKKLAHVDLHYTRENVYATLIVEDQLPEDQVLDLIERIDESLVLSAEVPREDLLVTVFHGRQLGLYSDAFLEERTRRRGAAEAPQATPQVRERRTRGVN